MSIRHSRGRCRECQRRKRKCDELRPCCSVCEKAGIPCMYASKFVTVDPATKEQRRGSASTSSPPSLRKNMMDMKLSTPTVPTMQSSDGTTPPAPVGVEEFAVLTATPLPDQQIRIKKDATDPVELMLPPTILKISTSTEVSQALIGLLNNYPDFCFCISTQSAWLRFLPARLPHSPLLERATAATLYAFHHIACGDERAKINAWCGYSAVIKLLRKVLSRGEEMKGEVVATIKILELFELVLGDGLTAYRSHSWGAVDFFQAAGPEFCRGEFEAALFHAVSGSAWLKGLITGEPSGFDEDEWLAVKSPSTLETPDSSALTRAMLLLPRLIKLVRELRSDPENSSLASKAVTVAETLLQSYQNLAEVEVPSIAKPCAATTSSPLPYTFHFPDPQIANAMLYARHWSLRILIACLCRSLGTTQHPRTTHWPSSSDFAQEEHRCARLICAAVPQTTSKYPHTASSALFPLQVAYGPLWRAYECDSSNYKAGRMVEWLEDRINDAGAYIGAQTNGDQLRALTAVFEGRTRWEF